MVKEKAKLTKIQALEGNLRSMIGMPVRVEMFSPKAASDIVGSVTTDEETDVWIDDRAVKIELERNDYACEWAYENDVTVANAVERVCNIMNNGLLEKTKTNEAKAKKAAELLEKKRKILKLHNKIDTMIKNRKIYSFTILKKTQRNSGDITRLVELNCNEDFCKPIRNLQTGELGGTVANKSGEYALVQKGKVASYDEQGNPTYNEKYFYFRRDEIVPWTNNDRGKFKGTSDIKRILRLLEIKLSVQNAIDLIIKRFGPQIWVMVGNENVNFTKVDLPQEYTRDSSGNLIDKPTALKNYKNDMFDEIRKEVKKWSDGETIVQIAEYGMEPKTFTPNANLFNYSRFIDLFSDYIKVGIFGLDVAGRVDVTSSLMLEGLFRDIKDKVTKERQQLIELINEEIAKPILKAHGFDEDIAWWEFNPLDKKDELQEALIEFRRSQAVRNYMDTVGKLPKYIVEKWELKWDENGPPPLKKSGPQGTPGKPFGKE